MDVQMTYSKRKACGSPPEQGEDEQTTGLPGSASVALTGSVLSAAWLIATEANPP